MATMQYETRARLQQRITQRLKGEFSLASNKHVVPSFVARHRRQMASIRQAEERPDPFKMQAQQFYEKRAKLGKQTGEVPSEYQLPVLRPRYLDMNGHTTKGIPNQTYVDLILDRKGPWQSLPVANKKITMGRKYDDSMVIRSYRNDEEVQSRKERNHPPLNAEVGFSRIMLIAPQKIQYSTSKNFNAGKVYTMDKATSPIKNNPEGSKLKIPVERDSSGEFFMKNKTKTFHKQRKKLSLEDKNFLKEMKKRNRRKVEEGVMPNDAIFGKAALPPIRITVTNPLPSPVPTGRATQPDKEDNIEEEIVNEDSSMFLQVPKSDLSKRKKRRKLERAKVLEHDSLENERREMLDPDSSYMPAPVTKITFETYNPLNVKQRQNVHIEQIIHGNISATKPKTESLKPVHVSNMEMGGYKSDIIHRKDGTVGPAPPSTNYVKFQRTTRLGGQSRVLMAMRQRQAHEHNHDDDYYLSDLDITNSNAYYLSDSSNNSGDTLPPDTRKLGKIKVLKSSALVKAHNQLMVNEDARVNFDSSSDDDSFIAIRQRRRKPGNLVTTATQVPMVIPTSESMRNDATIQGFYMGTGRDNAGELFLQQMTASNTEDLLAPPNTAYDSRPSS